MSDIYTIRLLSLLVTCLSIWRLTTRFRYGRILTLSGGLHFNTLLALGISPFIYTFEFESLAGERLSKDVILSSSIGGFTCFTIGYLLACIFESRKKYEASLFRFRPFRHQEMTPGQLLLLIGIVIIGVIGAKFGFGTSGAGTIFVIFYLLFYPLIVLSVMKLDTKNAVSMLFCICLLATTFTLVLTSPWRSQLVLWGFSCFIGIIIRFGLRFRYVTLLAALFGGTFFIVAPFLHLKKVRAGDADFNVVSLFIESQRITIDTRIENTFGFVAARVNAVREMGFVGNGLEMGLTDKRMGDTYIEAILQLIPRIVWPNKPVFNYTSGFQIAREIMLLGWEDEATSAAVTIWPEAMLNFGPYFLIIFVPFLYIAFTQIDRYTRKLIKQSAGLWLLDTAYFFVVFGLSSIVAFGTQFLWTFIIVWLFSTLFLGKGNEMHSTIRADARDLVGIRNKR